MATDEVGLIPSRVKQEGREAEAAHGPLAKTTSASQLQGEIAQGSQGKRKRSRSFRFAKRLSFRWGLASRNGRASGHPCGHIANAICNHGHS